MRSPALILFSLALAPLVAEPAAPSSQAPPTMTNQVGAHTPSRMRAMTCTPDGRWLFQAEGGSMTFIETRDSSDNYTSDNFESPTGSKRVPVGASGVLAAAMILDPGANTTPEDGSNDLLYIAAGRDGLWAMEADTRVSVTDNRAWRIDDSGNLNEQTQNSRRWCSDVATFQLNGSWYLAAIFGRKSGSRLRIYDLDEIRTWCDQSGELQTNGIPEIQVQVLLEDHPSIELIGQQIDEFGRSVAVAMDVDVPPPGNSVVHFYVAMGHHGIVRVEVSATDLENGPNQAPPITEWGPFFGNGSPYAVNTTGLAPASKQGTPNLYEHLDYTYYREYLPGNQRLDRTERPFVADVAVHRTASDLHLYVAADHLFWMRFDLGNTLWRDDMVIDHHEGRRDLWTSPSIPNPPEHPVVTPVPYPSGVWAGCARSLTVVEHDDGPFLFVTTGRLYVKDYLIYQTEGVAYDGEFAWGGGWGSIGASLGGNADDTEALTLYYKLDDVADPLVDGQFNVENWLDHGGAGLAAPSAPNQTGSRVDIFHNFTFDPPNNSGLKNLGVCLSRPRSDATYSGSGQPDGVGQSHVYQRSVTHTYGRHAFSLSYIKSHPQLLMPGGNDGDLPYDGFLVTDAVTASSTVVFETKGPLGDDTVAMNGHLFDGVAQWSPAGQPNIVRLFGGGKNNVDLFQDSHDRWLFLEIDVPTNPFVVAPTHNNRWYITPPRDRFLSYGRVYYLAGYTNPEFNDWAVQNGSSGLLFGTRYRSADGIVAFRLEELAGHLTQANAGEDIPLTPTINPADMRTLITQPEFGNMDHLHPSAQSWWQGTSGLSDDVGLVANWSPVVVQVHDPVTADYTRWVVAAPCGRVWGGTDWEIYEGSPNDQWVPTPDWQADSGKGLIQFWELELQNGQYWPRVGTTPLGASGSSDLAWIVTPDVGANVWKLESVRMPVGGSDRTFLFMVDFAGHLHVRSIEGILSEQVDELPVEVSWSTAEAFFDDLPSAIFDIAIDHRGTDTATVYACVRRTGVEVLEFDASVPSLTWVDRIQTPEHPSAVEVREYLGGSTDLLVSDYGGGVRVYGE